MRSCGRRLAALPHCVSALNPPSVSHAPMSAPRDLRRTGFSVVSARNRHATWDPFRREASLPESRRSDSFSAGARRTSAWPRAAAPNAMRRGRQDRCIDDHCGDAARPRRRPRPLDVDIRAGSEAIGPRIQRRATSFARPDGSLQGGRRGGDEHMRRRTARVGITTATSCWGRRLPRQASSAAHSMT
jgi:hypothetical protein